MQNELYLFFIDYTKAFDNVQHRKLFQDLSALDLDGKDLRFIRNLYWEQTACMRVENDNNNNNEDNLYGKKIFRELEDLEGINVGGHNLNNLRFADDSALVAHIQEGPQDLLNKVVAESKKKGLEINRKKTVCMVVSK